MGESTAERSEAKFGVGGSQVVLWLVNCHKNSRYKNNIDHPLPQPYRAAVPSPTPWGTFPRDRPPPTPALLGCGTFPHFVGDCFQESPFSATSFSICRPFSKSGPTILSMLLKMPITLVINVIGPVIDHVTSVESPFGWSVKVLVLLDLKGFRKSRATWIRDGSEASNISMRPSPTLRFPVHEYFAPTPESEPEKVFSMLGSISSQGDHFPHFRKSIMWR